MSTEKPRRRRRYSGKNPRRFSEKYKELAPERYADDVARIIATGKTPAGMIPPFFYWLPVGLAFAPSFSYWLRPIGLAFAPLILI